MISAFVKLDMDERDNKYQKPFARNQIQLESWPNMTWHVYGGITHPGQPDAIFGRVDDHD